MTTPKIPGELFSAVTKAHQQQLHTAAVEEWKKHWENVHAFSAAAERLHATHPEAANAARVESANAVRVANVLAARAEKYGPRPGRSIMPTSAPEHAIAEAVDVVKRTTGRRR